MKKSKSRFLFIYIIVIIAFVALLLKLFYMQNFQSDEYRKALKNRASVSGVVKAPRGSILD